MSLSVSRKWLAVAAILVVALVAFGCGDDTADLPEDAVAQVGDTTITRAQLDERVAAIQDQLGEQVPTKEESPEEFEVFEQQVLDYMITVEVVNQKATELGVEVTPDEVDAQVDQIKSMFGDDEQAFEDAIAEQNLTVDELRANLEEQQLITETIDEVTKDVQVTDEEIQAKYDENPEQYQVSESRKTRHILFSPGNLADEPGAEVTDAEWEAARQEAEDVRQQILDGADFAEMAKQYSDDPGSKEQGGDLGNVTPGTMVPEFDEKVFSMEQGEISEPVRTQFGYHIIQVQEINPARTLELDEVRDSIEAELLDQKKREAWESWLADTKDELGVVVAEGLEYVTTTTEAGATTDETTAEEPAEDTTTTTAAE